MSKFVQNNTMRGLKFLISLPKIFRRWFVWRRMRLDPYFQKKSGGTINITSVGMFGNVAGWPLIHSTYPMSIAVGSIVKKPWNVNGQIVLRDILHLTILLDHDVIDGAPAARFLHELTKKIETAAGLS